MPFAGNAFLQRGGRGGGRAGGGGGLGAGRAMTVWGRRRSGGVKLQF